MLRITMLALALALLVPADRASAQEVRTHTIIHDDGTRTTEVIRDSDWDSVPVVRRAWGTTGYQVMPRYHYPRSDHDSFGFPLNPRDGQKVRINGVKYEWDAEDQRWERD